MQCHRIPGPGVRRPLRMTTISVRGYQRYQGSLALHHHFPLPLFVSNSDQSGIARLSFHLAHPLPPPRAKVYPPNLPHRRQTEPPAEPHVSQTPILTTVFHPDGRLVFAGGPQVLLPHLGPGVVCAGEGRQDLHIANQCVLVQMLGISELADASHTVGEVGWCRGLGRKPAWWLGNEPGKIRLLRFGSR